MGLPHLNLVGIDPAAQREYVWIGDDAVEQPVTDEAAEAWVRDGTIPPLKPGSEPVRFRTQSLTTTVMAIVWNYASVIPGRHEPSTTPLSAPEITMRNLPASMRMAFAYGVVSITGDGAPKLTRVMDAGGWRVSDELLDALDRQCVQDGTSLVQHLGALVLRDSRPTALESKP